MDLIEVFLWVSRKLIILVFLYPVFFDKYARDLTGPSPVWLYFSLKVGKMISFCTRMSWYFRTC